MRDDPNGANTGSCIDNVVESRAAREAVDGLNAELRSSSPVEPIDP